MERRELHEAIDRAAHERLNEVGVTPTSDFDDEMARAMDSAVDRMADEGALDDTLKLREAETNTVVLVDAITVEVREAGATAADASAFRRALRRVCPLYPFC